MTAVKKRTLDVNAKETSQAIESMEELQAKLRRLKQYEDEMANLQGESLQRFTVLADYKLSRDDWDRLDVMINDMRRLSMRTHARIEENEASIKKELNIVDEQLANLHYERATLLAQEETKGGQ